MKKKTDGRRSFLKRAGIALLIFVLTYAVISMIASAVVYTLIFENIPVDEVSFGYSYNDFAEAYPRCAVEFESDKNILRGYLYSRDEPKGLVIISNGLGSQADSHLGEIMYFVDDGWQVLDYSGTGIGESDGDSIVGLSQMRLDLIAAIDFAESECGLPIVVYGHSAGGYAAASSLGARNIAGAVSVAGFNSPTETMFYKAWEYVGVLADMEKPFLMLQHRFVFGEDGFVDAIDSINSTDTPIAVYYGDSDTTIPYPVSVYSHREESENPNAVFTKIDGSHSDVWFSDEAQEYRAELYEKFDALADDAVREEFLANVDRRRANELDTDFMRAVTEFFESAIEKRK